MMLRPAGRGPVTGKNLKSESRQAAAAAEVDSESEHDLALTPGAGGPGRRLGIPPWSQWMRGRGQPVLKAR